jgi:hypothetical protein
MAFNVVTTLATYLRGTREAFIRQIGFLVPQGCPAPQTVEYASPLSVSAAILVHFIHSCICLRRYNVQGPELLVFFFGSAMISACTKSRLASCCTSTNRFQQQMIALCFSDWQSV